MLTNRLKRTFKTTDRNLTTIPLKVEVRHDFHLGYARLVRSAEIRYFFKLVIPPEYGVKTWAGLSSTRTSIRWG